MTSMVREEPVQISPRLFAALDFLRWTAAFAVLAGHVRAFCFPPYGEFANPGVLTRAFYLGTGFGHQAVMVFFVLSGFLVGGRALEKMEHQKFKPGDYMIDRVSRLYPVFIACLVLTAYLYCKGSLQPTTLAMRYGLTGAVIVLSIIVSFAISRITEAKTSSIRQFIRQRFSD